MSRGIFVEAYDKKENHYSREAVKTCDRVVVTVPAGFGCVEVTFEDIHVTFRMQNGTGRTFKKLGPLTLGDLIDPEQETTKQFDEAMDDLSGVADLLKKAGIRENPTPE